MTPGRRAAASFSRATSSIPADGSAGRARRRRPRAPARAARSRPRPRPSASVGRQRDGRPDRLATPSADSSSLVGVSQSRARSSNVAIGRSEGPGEHDVRRAVGAAREVRRSAPSGPGSRASPRAAGARAPPRAARSSGRRARSAARRGAGDRRRSSRRRPARRSARRSPRRVELGRASRKSTGSRLARSRTGPPRRTGRARSGRGRRRAGGGRRTGPGRRTRPRRRSRGRGRSSRASPATRSMRLPIGPVYGPVDPLLRLRRTAPASSSAKKIMSRSPGDRPASVRSAAASERCWVPWFTTWASICQNGTPSSQLGEPRVGERRRARRRARPTRPPSAAASAAGDGSGSRSGTRRLVAPRQAVPPALVRAELVDEDRAEAALADHAGRAPDGLRRGRRSREQHAPRRPAVVGEQVADVGVVHGRRPWPQPR